MGGVRGVLGGREESQWEMPKKYVKEMPRGEICQGDAQESQASPHADEVIQWRVGSSRQRRVQQLAGPRRRVLHQPTPVLWMVVQGCGRKAKRRRKS